MISRDRSKAGAFPLLCDTDVSAQSCGAALLSSVRIPYTLALAYTIRLTYLYAPTLAHAPTLALPLLSPLPFALAFPCSSLALPMLYPTLALA